MPGNTQDMAKLEGEIGRLVKYIEDAKREICAMSVDGASKQALCDVSLHLDTVIKSTEEASHAIMDAADAIQNAATGIGGEKEKTILEATTRIYEACNFQDLTSQRITKVVKLIGVMEERMLHLLKYFNIQTGAEAKPSTPTQKSADDKRFLNGPALPGQGVSQSDVDALFTASKKAGE